MTMNVAMTMTMTMNVEDKDDEGEKLYKDQESYFVMHLPDFGFFHTAAVTEDNSDRIVTDDDLRVLSLCIDKSFKAFGREVLKFTAKEIEKFQRQSDCEHKQASNMLHKWKQRLGHLATVSKLTSLLKDFNYGPDVWGFLEGIPMDVTEGDSSGGKYLFSMFGRDYEWQPWLGSGLQRAVQGCLCVWGEVGGNAP